MTEGVNFNFKTHVDVTQWGTMPQGQNNDCYWNIAQNTFEEEATAQDIQLRMEEFIELNFEEGQDPNLLLPGEEVLVPVDVAVESSNEEMANTCDSYNSSVDDYSNGVDGLDKSIAALKDARSQYETAIADDEGEYSQEDIDALYENYQNSVRELNEKTKEIEEQEQKAQQSKEEVDGWISALNDLESEYEGTAADMNEVRECINSEISKINSNVADNETKFSQLQNKKDALLGEAEKELQNAADLKAPETNESTSYSGCTDGEDDGKLSGKEVAKNIGYGVVDKATEQISSAINTVKEHPVMTGAAVAAVGAAAILGGPIVGAALAAVSVVGGVAAAAKSAKGIYDGYNAYKEADNDNDAKQALQDIGGNALTGAEGAVTAAAGALQGAKAVQAIANTSKAGSATTAVSTVNDAPKGAAAGKTQEVDKFAKMVKANIDEAEGGLNKMDEFSSYNINSSDVDEALKQLKEIRDNIVKLTHADNYKEGELSPEQAEKMNEICTNAIIKYNQFKKALRQSRAAG